MTGLSRRAFASKQLFSTGCCCREPNRRCGRLSRISPSHTRRRHGQTKRGEPRARDRGAGGVGADVRARAGRAGGAVCGAAARAAGALPGPAAGRGGRGPHVLQRGADRGREPRDPGRPGGAARRRARRPRRPRARGRRVRAPHAVPEELHAVLQQLRGRHPLRDALPRGEPHVPRAVPRCGPATAMGGGRG